MSININSALRNFNEAVSYGMSDNARMILKDGDVKRGADDAGILGRAKPVSVQDDDTQARQNNAVRTKLMNALVSQYGTKAKIPASVLRALKGSSFVGGSDMKMDVNGNVISGRPLTARRIRAVLKAVSADLAKSAPVDNTPYWQGDLSAEGATPSEAKIRGRLEKMSTVSPDNRFPRAAIHRNVVVSFSSLIKTAQTKGKYGEEMVTFLMGRIKARNSATRGWTDREWFQGLLDNDDARLRRDICRFLNVGGQYGEYWQDPEAATKRDVDELNMQRADAKSPDFE